jgi:putative ABC transport system permease protein
MYQLAADFVFSLRMWRRAPGIVTLAVLSLSLGLAANTAVFSFVNAIQFRPLPVQDEATLVDLSETSATELCAGCEVGTSYPGYLDWKAAARSYAAIEAYKEEPVVVSGGTGPERVTAAVASSGLFRTLGIRPSLGRDFVSDDDGLGATPVVIISDLLWRRRFDGDPAVVGRTIRVNGSDRTVIGVMPPSFRFPEFTQLWMPLAPAAANWARDDRSLGVLARLRPGATVEQADAELRTIAAALEQQYPENRRWTTQVRTLREDLTRETATASIVLLSAVAFVLLIACANVANLLVVRAAERRRELSIRSALGASRASLARLLITEGLTLAAAGGILGWLAALWAARLLVSSFSVEAPYWIQFGIDWRVFVFACTATVATGLLCGAAPALHMKDTALQAALRDGGAATGGRSARRFRSALVAVQLALSLLLLAGAGLLIKTVVRTYRFDIGYDASHVLVGDVALAGGRYEDPGQVRAFADRVVEALDRIPGVRAAMSRTIFFAGFGGQPQRMAVDGMSDVPQQASPSFYHAVTPSFFDVTGIRLLAGRRFTAREAEPVVVVNEELARRVWSDRSPLGQRIRFSRNASDPWLTVVGVVSANGGSPLGIGPRPTAYVPFAVAPGRDLAIYLSASSDPLALVNDVRSAVAALDPDQPVEGLMTMEQTMAEWVAPARFVALLMSSLAVVALLMASMGTFGVIAYSVSQRTREIGIRLALGATPGQVQALVARGGARMTLAGLALGLPAAWGTTRALEGILAGTSPTDPAVFALVTATLAGVALLASWLPAKRAARVDPLIVLRHE